MCRITQTTSERGLESESSGLSRAVCESISVHRKSAFSYLFFLACSMHDSRLHAVELRSGLDAPRRAGPEPESDLFVPFGPGSTDLSNEDEILAADLRGYDIFCCLSFKLCSTSKG